METTTKVAYGQDRARELFLRHHTRYEVSLHYIVVDARTADGSQSQKRIHAGFDVNLYGKGLDHSSTLSFNNGEPRSTLDELCMACEQMVASLTESCRIEVIPWPATLLFNMKSRFEPEASVRIQITHYRGVDQPAGQREEAELARVVDRLEFLGVRRT